MLTHWNCRAKRTGYLLKSFLWKTNEVNKEKGDGVYPISCTLLVNPSTQGEIGALHEMELSPAKSICEPSFTKIFTKLIFKDFFQAQQVLESVISDYN